MGSNRTLKLRNGTHKQGEREDNNIAERGRQLRAKVHFFYLILHEVAPARITGPTTLIVTPSHSRFLSVSVPSCSARSCLRAFAFVVLPPWYAQLPDLCMSGSSLTRRSQLKCHHLRKDFPCHSI